MAKMAWEKRKPNFSNLYYRNKIFKQPPKPKKVSRNRQNLSKF